MKGASVKQPKSIASLRADLALARATLQDVLLQGHESDPELLVAAMAAVLHARLSLGSTEMRGGHEGERRSLDQDFSSRRVLVLTDGAVPSVGSLRDFLSAPTSAGGAESFFQPEQ